MPNRLDRHHSPSRGRRGSTSGAGARRAPPWSRSVDADDLAPPPDLRDLLLVAWRRRWIVLGVCATVVVLVAAHALTRAPRYRATAVIRISDAGAGVASGLERTAVEPLLGRTTDPLLSRLEVLRSRTVIGQVIDSVPLLRLELTGLPVDALEDVAIPDDTTREAHDSLVLWLTADRVTGVLRGARASAAIGEPLVLGGYRLTVAGPQEAGRAVVRLRSREEATRALINGLKLEPREATDIVDVTYTSQSPRLSQMVVNRAADGFREASMQLVRDRVQRRRVLLQGLLTRNDAELAEARRALGEFRSRTRLLSTRERFATEQAALGSVRVRREELDAERRVYASLLEALQRSRGSGAGESEALGALVSAPGSSSNPVISQLFGQLTGYVTARDSLTMGAWARSPEHPDVRRLDTLIAATKLKLARAVRGVMASLDARIRALDQIGAENSATFRELSAGEMEEAQLLERVEAARRIGDQLREEYRKAHLTEAVEVGDVSVVDTATLPDAPVNANGLVRWLAFGLLLGLALGGATAVTVEHFSTAIRRQDELEDALQVRGLVVVPRSPAREIRVPARWWQNDTAEPARPGGALVTVADPSSCGSEAFRALRTKLMISGAAQPLRRILVTSPAAKDGKTTVAANLAAVYAEQGLRTLLVDCDMRRPRQHQMFRLPLQPGLSTLVSGRCTPDDAIRDTGLERLAVLPAGPLPRNPVELLGTDAMQATLGWLFERYDVVVLDTPPVLAAADALVLSGYSDGVLLVTRAGSTGRVEAQAALQQLQDVNANVIGAILNDPDAVVPRSGGRYYYYGYEARA